MIKAIAIDDEPPALEIIKVYAEKVPFVQLKACFVRPSEALTYIRHNNIDLAFIDISMPDISGIELATKLKGSCQIVFTTAYSEYALKGFELAATDYLLKPISFARFLDACTRTQERLRSRDTGNHPKESPSLFLKDGHNWIRIDCDDILYIKAEDNYVSIIERNRRTLSRITLSKIQEQLPASTFMRVHKSYIVSLAHVNKLEKNEVFINGVKVPLSKGGRDELFKKLMKPAPGEH